MLGTQQCPRQPPALPLAGIQVYALSSPESGNPEWAKLGWGRQKGCLNVGRVVKEGFMEEGRAEQFCGG